MILEGGNNINLIFYFLHLLKKLFTKKLVELPFYLNFELKFSGSTGDDCNLVYNKNSNNYILAT